MLPLALKKILKQHSRSFYLSLQILPSSLRFPISLAYLLARMADTIADTSLVPRELRIETLQRFSQAVQHSGRFKWLQNDFSPEKFSLSEVQLLQQSDSAIALLPELGEKNCGLVQKIVRTLIQGMIQNLNDFPGENRSEIFSLKNNKHLEEYCYYAAGCVGEFWTAISFQKVPKLRSRNFEKMQQWGKAFGEGLQLINILQDIPRDLDSGRCYLPEAELKKLEVFVQNLNATPEKIKPLLNEMMQEAEKKLKQGILYVESIPHGEIRLRLACAWPLLIGLKTLQKLRREENLILPPQKIKISRQEVYQILGKTLFLFPIPRGSRFCFTF
ncbi:MAG: phytoene/squalene synthase family protein [Planctomycetota bacterium]